MNFIVVTDRGSMTPIILNVTDILAVWTAVDPGDEETGQMVVGSNIFTRTPHGAVDENHQNPRVCVTENPSLIAAALAAAGASIGGPQ